MTRTHLVLFCGALLLGGCANPINRVTSDDYAKTCATAEDNRRLDVAEQACYRALVNVDIGNLGPELKSERLYNLGRIKRQLSKFSEAEDLFKQSLAIEEKLSGATEVKVGRRLIELSISLAAQDKWIEGGPILERAIPITPRFTGRERAVAEMVFAEYGKHFRRVNQPALAERFEKASASK